MIHRTFLSFLAIVGVTGSLGLAAEKPGHRPYLDRVRQCADVLLQHGTDRYGPVQSPILVSILDVQERTCPKNPLPLDEACRVGRRERRNPAGANLLTDQPLLKSLRFLSAVTGAPKYDRAARDYIDYYLKHLVDEKGFFWWGWHRHYDVYEDRMTGHLGNPHEIHAIHGIAWEQLWEVNPKAVRREIEAIWQWHVIDKKTGEINRHGDGQRGCDFSMSAGAIIEAFAFLHQRTGEKVWLDRARLVADYYWTRRHPQTNLIPERPNAGKDRFDGSAFVTCITGLYCLSLLKAQELTGEAAFKEQSLAYLRAYARHGYDEKSGKFWGALNLDGTPIPGPRLMQGYAMYEPRGYLDLWEPYVAGYQCPVYTAQAYAVAYQGTREEALLKAARAFAAWMEKTPPGTVETNRTWYDAYTRGPGLKGTYADKYGRAVSFLLHLFLLTKETRYLQQAEKMADEAIEKLWANGLFRGHPAKPYYEAMDGVGYLLYALLQLDAVKQDPDKALTRQALVVGRPGITLPLENR